MGTVFRGKRQMKLDLGSMGWRKSATVHKNLKIYAQVLGFVLICVAQFSCGLTNPNDFAAISDLHAAFGYPTLPGWGTGQDPCGDAWQGVVCNISDIVKIVVNAANLGGELGDNLAMFTSINTIDLSNNRIGGSIPYNLPITMQNFFLSANQFTGSIPSSLSTLIQLTALSLNENYLSGEIPDSFKMLFGLVNLDLSNNNLSGPLPLSMENLLALTTLRLQNNQLSGTLDVLQDLPLKDLNIENNLFSGPIPPKLMSIPNFRYDGNPFNSSVSPVPSPATPSKQSPVPFFPGEPPPEKAPPELADGPSSSNESKSGDKKRIVWISIAAVISFIILALVLILFLPRCLRGSREDDRNFKRHQIGAYKGDRESPRNDVPHHPPTNKIEKVPKDALAEPKESRQAETQRIEAIPERTALKQDYHEIDIKALDDYLIPPRPPPPPPPPPRPRPPPPPPPPPPPRPPPFAAKINKETIIPTQTPMKPSSTKLNTPTFAKSFDIASLQQFTNSFSQENLIGGGMLGNVYKALIPNGKLLAVKKLDQRTCSQQKDDDFLEMVNNIDTIRHHNIVELMGYCAEHDQRLLIYEYCNNGTLQDALHSGDETKNKLSWNIRLQMALGAARALEYLHEVCQPPVMHRNFNSANILLDDDYSVRVSDCGLSPLISSGSVSQLSGHLQSVYGWGAPEYESGIYTLKSDVYSFGVVMLELLTGRMSHDRTRIRGEQFLARWAIPQLHDIDALSRMVDPSLGLEYPAKSLSHFADIISRCVQSEPEFRPAMSEVVQDLLDMIRRESHGSGSAED